MSQKKIVGKPFEKGHDPRRNLNGRGESVPPIDDIIIRVLTKENEKGLQVLEGIITAQVNKALKGDTKAFEVLVERGWGKAKQFVQQEIKGGFVIQVGNNEEKDIIDGI
jgi:hypothetical protein